jgi:glutathione S-transferase
MLKLYGISISNYANMVKQFLIEKGIEFEQLHVRPNQDANFLAKSPMGKIPCLETPDGFLIETASILNYLEDIYPEPRLYPSDAYAKAKASEIMHIVELYIELAARRHLGAAVFGQERSDEAMAQVRPQVEKGLKAFSQLANFGPYVMGSDFSVVDIFVFHTFELAGRVLKQTYDWDIRSEVPGFDRFLDTMNKRDSTKTVIADRDAAMSAFTAQNAAANQK